ncbi:hypothetical protein, partial [Actinoallomurus sp. NPDC050550]|uniref:hypothetical protein n=1 Tax=Actinoallomurus sp. NPDC050550 TaxID=3154937 RepID=UPI003402FBD6
MIVGLGKAISDRQAQIRADLLVGGQPIDLTSLNHAFATDSVLNSLRAAFGNWRTGRPAVVPGVGVGVGDEVAGSSAVGDGSAVVDSGESLAGGHVLGVPARPHEWLAANRDVSTVVLKAEQFDPFVEQDGRPEGLLAGRNVIIRANVRRVRAVGGQGVREFTLALPVGDVASGLDVAVFRDRLQGLLDEYVNRGYVLPRSEEQLHVWAELVLDRGHGEGITLTAGAVPGAADQLHFDVGHSDAQLLHELLHYLGLADASRAEEMVFRGGDHVVKRPGSEGSTDRVARTGVDADGLMAGTQDSVLAAGLLPRDLARIEAVSDAGPYIADPPRLDFGRVAGASLPVGDDTGGYLEWLPPSARRPVTDHETKLTHAVAQAPGTPRWWG